MKTKRTKANLSTIEWLHPPEQGRWTTATWYRWPTACGRYYVYRVMSPAGEYPVEYAGTVKRMRDGSPRWEMISHDREKGIGYPKKYKTLDEAMASVEKYHATKNNLDIVGSNRIRIVELADKQGIAAAVDKDKQRKSAQLPIKQSQQPKEQSQPRTLSQAIVAALKRASRQSPISKEMLVDAIAADFSNWKRKSLIALVERKIPQGLRDKGIRVHKSQKGYWIEA